MLNEEAEVYPMSAIIGQEQLKKALILMLINPGIDGLLIVGERGTGKTVAVNALRDLLPTVPKVADCRFNCTTALPERMCSDCSRKYVDGSASIKNARLPLVYVPHNITWNDVSGDFVGNTFRPGLLANANNGLLVIRHVNRFNNEFTMNILEIAGQGENAVGRGKMEMTHPCKFGTVATMNSEEGTLSNSILKQFAMSVFVDGLRDVEERIEITNRIAAYHADPKEFISRFAAQQRTMRDKIVAARAILPKVIIPEKVSAAARRICTEVGVVNIIASDVDVVAVTNAAFEGRTMVTPDDLAEAVSYALPHRLYKGK